MCRKFVLFVCFTLALFLVGAVQAALPAGWQSQDINTTGGSANESNGTWTVIGDGADIWGTSDAFHYAYVPLIGDGEISARVVDNGTGSNTWAKGGVMIRETLDANSKHVMMIMTDSDGGGIAFQSRFAGAGSNSSSLHGATTASPPHWVRLVREGDMITGYHSDDGINWVLFTSTPDNTGGTITNPLEISMADEVYIGLCVTSHAAGELRTYKFDNVNVMLPVIATSPDPADGSIHTETWASLSWNAGEGAVSHDVYFGENAADVEAGTGDTFGGNVTDTYFIVGFVGNPYPDGLTNGITYYWRVDEVEADGTKHTGKVWSFTVPPMTAYNPSPGNGAAFIDGTNLSLTWASGYGAKLHYVYFGDDYDTVANATTGGRLIGLTSYKPGPLEIDKTYYWRVDESAGPTILYPGEVWSFKTAKEGGGIKAQYYNGMNFDNLVLTRIDPQINFNWGDPGSPDTSVNVDQFSARWTGEVEAAFTETYTFYTTSDDGARLWVNGVQLVDSWVDQSATEHSGTIDLVAGTTYSLIMEYYENTGGAVAELRWSSPSTPKQLIPQAALSLPVRASAPSPASGATGTKLTPILKWSPGDFAVSHEVYFGTDADAVRNADKSSPEYKGTKALGNESYDPGKLAWFTSYYWRIDEVNAVNPDSPWSGNVWSFTTGDFILIDNFEEYNSGENQIWYSWKDGLGYGAPGTDSYYAGNGTGAAVGDETTSSYTEETIFHDGGHQSMPLSYDNNKTGFSKYSETELTLTDTRDWTDENVAELSIWFRGYPASTGSFVESPAGTFTITASGADIWAVNGVEADEFHFAYKMLTGSGSIIAKVNSVDNTNAWAKAGVMIRETLNPDSAHAMMVVTPGSGISFQRRPGTGATSVDTTTAGITPPYWVKIERDLAGNFTASSSPNGSTWTQVGTENIPMGANTYIGLAVTAHDATLTCKAVFTNVTITGNVTGQWADQDIGIPSNDPEPLYVAVSNSNGTTAIVVNDDPAAAQISTWTEWVIPLSVFADQGINLTNVDSIALGLGTRGNTTVAGGSGKMFFDDIRLYRERPEPEPQP